MISSLSISGFKSLVDRVIVRFAPLTVLTGANSSGKSTVLQAILILKQTAEQPPYDATLRLNGPYGLLGTGQIISACEAEVSLEWENSAGARLTFCVNVVQRDGQAAIERISGPANSTIVRREPTQSERSYLVERAGELFEGGSKRFMVCGIAATDEIRDVETYTTVQSRQLRRRCDQLLSAHVRDTLSSDVGLSSSADRQNADLTIRFLDENKVSQSVAAFVQIEDVRRRTGEFSADVPADLWKYVPDDYVALVNSLGPFGPWEDLLNALANLADGFEEERHELISVRDVGDQPLLGLLRRVLYLGPLRSDPQIVYPDVVYRDPERMGPKGECFVPLLYYRRGATVEDIDPGSLEEGRRKRNTTLSRSVNSWMSYLGVGSAVDVKPDPPYGLSIRVRDDESSHWVSLTNVGVGVSQVLPILILGLLAPRGSIVILEQPELHLHPAIQSRLGDFLIALSRIGKQIIIETHSEHLVNRLRLHIARGGLHKDDASVLFLERDGEGTRVTPVQIDETGFVENWPVGFFDESEQVLLEIGNAITRK